MTVESRNGLARASQGGQLSTEAPANPWASVGLLKPYAHGVSQERPRMDALATISAGFKGEKNGRSFPVVSRDGTIQISDPSGRAPGLAAELKRRQGKSLTIAVVSNDPGEVLQQGFAYRSATRLMAHGNHESVTVINVREEQDETGKAVQVVERRSHAAGTPTYRAAVEKCKVESNFYFVLARWDEQGNPKLVFPDGLGFYRLRFTSLNSAENIRSQLAYIASLPITGGRVAGIPLELAIDYREVSGPDGSRRRVPVWTLVLRPPCAIELDVAATTRILERGMAQAEGLALPMPRLETFEDAEVEGPGIDLDQAVIEGEARTVSPDEVRHLRDGGKADPDWLIRQYFAGAGRTSLRDDDGRERFLLAFTRGRTGSLAEFAATATRRQSEDLLKALAVAVGEEIAGRQDAGMPAVEPVTVVSPRPGRGYHDIFGADDDDAPPVRQPEPVRVVEIGEDVKAAAVLTGAPGASVVDEEDADEFRADLVAELRALVNEASGRGIVFDFPPLEDQPSEVIHGLLSQVHAALDAQVADQLVDAF